MEMMSMLRFLDLLLVLFLGTPLEHLDASAYLRQQGLERTQPVLERTIADPKLPLGVRVAALSYLTAMELPTLLPKLETALAAETDPAMRRHLGMAIRTLAKTPLDDLAGPGTCADLVKVFPSDTSILVTHDRRRGAGLDRLPGLLQETLAKHAPPQALEMAVRLRQLVGQAWPYLSAVVADRFVFGAWGKDKAVDGAALVVRGAFSAAALAAAWNVPGRPARADIPGLDGATAWSLREGTGGQGIYLCVDAAGTTAVILGAETGARDALARFMRALRTGTDRLRDNPLRGLASPGGLTCAMLPGGARQPLGWLLDNLGGAGGRGPVAGWVTLTDVATLAFQAGLRYAPGEEPVAAATAAALRARLAEGIAQMETQMERHARENDAVRRFAADTLAYTRGLEVEASGREVRLRSTKDLPAMQAVLFFLLGYSAGLGHR